MAFSQMSIFQGKKPNVSWFCLVSMTQMFPESVTTTIIVSSARQKLVGVSLGGTPGRRGAIWRVNFTLATSPPKSSSQNWEEPWRIRLRPLQRGREVTANLLTTIDFARWKMMPRRRPSPAPPPSYMQQPDLISCFGEERRA